MNQKISEILAKYSVPAHLLRPFTEEIEREAYIPNWDNIDEDITGAGVLFTVERTGAMTGNMPDWTWKSPIEPLKIFTRPPRVWTFDEKVKALSDTLKMSLETIAKLDPEEIGVMFNACKAKGII